jgi:biotin/methionine sulfoxide reductase
VGGSSRDPFVFAMHKAIEPVGEARSDFDIFSALAERLGYAEAFTESRDEMAWCRSIYDRFVTSAARKNVSFPAFDEFWRDGFIELPPPDEDFVLFADFRRDPVLHPLKTPSGRIEIASETIARFGYDDCPPHPAWLEPAEWLGGAGTAQWPLHLITHQPADRLHSQLDPARLSRGNKIKDREVVRLNPDDATRRGIRNHDVVRVFNARGACLAAAVLDPDVMPRVAVMATGAWFDPPASADAPERHGNPNVLTHDIGTSRLTQGPSALSALVDIERWDAELPATSVFTPPTMIGADAAPA